MIHHTVLILMIYKNIFLQAQCFYGYNEQGQYPLISQVGKDIFLAAHWQPPLLVWILQMLLTFLLKLNAIQLYKQLVIPP